MSLFVFDLDGTLALRDESRSDCRTHYEWARVGEDLPNPPVVAVARSLLGAGHKLLFVTGRMEQCRSQTHLWLIKHLGTSGVGLLMRADEDFRKDTEVKPEMYDGILCRMLRSHFGEVVAVFDDRKAVVEMWRELGLTVFQVAPGEF
jgi:phosphoglycolate phosphatase-like HAD superfamily hydrolase